MIIYDICMDIHQTCQCFLILYLWGLQPSNHPCGIIGVSLDSLMASSHLKRSVMCLLNRDLVPKMQKMDIHFFPQSHILGQDFFTYHSSKFRYTTFIGCCLFGAVPKSRDSKLLHELDAGDVLRHSPEPKALSIWDGQIGAKVCRLVDKTASSLFFAKNPFKLQFFISELVWPTTYHHHIFCCVDGVVVLHRCRRCIAHLDLNRSPLGSQDGHGPQSLEPATFNKTYKDPGCFLKTTKISFPNFCSWTLTIL